MRNLKLISSFFILQKIEAVATLRIKVAKSSKKQIMLISSLMTETIIATSSIDTQKAAALIDAIQ